MSSAWNVNTLATSTMMPQHVMIASLKTRATSTSDNNMCILITSSSMLKSTENSSASWNTSSESLRNTILTPKTIHFMDLVKVPVILAHAGSQSVAASFVCVTLKPTCGQHTILMAMLKQCSALMLSLMTQHRCLQLMMKWHWRICNVTCKRMQICGMDWHMPQVVHSTQWKVLSLRLNGVSPLMENQFSWNLASLFSTQSHSVDQMVVHPTLANQNNRCHLIAQCAKHNGEKFESWRTGIQKEMQQMCSGAQLLPFFSQQQWNSLPLIFCTISAVSIASNLCDQGVTPHFTATSDRSFLKHDEPQSQHATSCHLCHKRVWQPWPAWFCHWTRHCSSVTNAETHMHCNEPWWSSQSCHQLASVNHWCEPTLHARHKTLATCRGTVDQFNLSILTWDQRWNSFWKCVDNSDHPWKWLTLDGSIHWWQIVLWHWNMMTQPLPNVSTGCDTGWHFGPHGKVDHVRSKQWWDWWWWHTSSLANSALNSWMANPTETKPIFLELVGVCPVTSLCRIIEFQHAQAKTGNMSSRLDGLPPCMDQHAWPTDWLPSPEMQQHQCTQNICMISTETQLCLLLCRHHLNDRAIAGHTPAHHHDQATKHPKSCSHMTNVSHWQGHWCTWPPTSFLWCWTLAEAPQRNWWTNPNCQSELHVLLCNNSWTMGLWPCVKHAHTTTHSWPFDWPDPKWQQENLHCQWCNDEWTPWQCALLDDCNWHWTTLGQQRCSPWASQQAHTGQSEGFGTLSTLQFACHHCMHHDLIDKYLINPLCCLHFCDNKGMTTRITDLVDMTIPALTLSTCDNFDLHVQICDTVQELEDLCSFQFQHIKGHQDWKPVHDKDGHAKPLSQEAELNVHCNEFAPLCIPTNWHAKSTDKSSPMFPTTRVHLLTDGKVVTKKLKEQMWGVATTQDWWVHLSEKLTWTDTDCKSVQWSTIESAMKWFSSSDKRHIQKWIHDWLPLNHFLCKWQHMHDPECPMCHNALEEHWHLIECLCQKQQQIFVSLWSTLMEFSEKTKASKQLVKLLWDGLQSIWQQTPMQDKATCDNMLHDLCDSQASLGWDQLHWGWLSCLWGTIFEQTSMPTGEADIKMGGHHWIAEMAAITWQHALLLWESRNGDQHGQTQEEQDQQECDKLWPQIQGTHAIWDQLPHAAQKEVHKVPFETLMEWPLNVLHQWIFIAWPHMQVQTKAAKN